MEPRRQPLGPTTVFRIGFGAMQLPGPGVFASGGVLRYDQPAQLREGIEDNLRSLAVDHLAVVNLRLMDDAEPGQLFDDQLAAMMKARDDGLIGSVGLSNASLDHLRHALAITAIACVQNLLNLADRRA